MSERMQRFCPMRPWRATAVPTSWIKMKNRAVRRIVYWLERGAALGGAE